MKQRIERPFGGIISGLVFNGLRILDLAYEKDRRTEIRGDVTRVSTVRNRLQEPMQYQQMPPVNIVHTQRRIPRRLQWAEAGVQTSGEPKF